MIRFIINENVHGYEKVDIENAQDSLESNNLYIVVIDKTQDEKMHIYYNFINTAIVKNNRVILVSLDDDNESFKPISSMMVNYRAYDIYQIADKRAFNAKYLESLEKRNPDYSEVQCYLDSEIAASDINNILFEITSLVEEGNLDRLKAFIETNMTAIDGMAASLNIMKKAYDIFNSNELVTDIKNLKSKNSKLKQEIEDREKDIDIIKQERDRHFNKTEELKRENEKLINDNKDLKASSSDGSIIRTYPTLDTRLLQCKAKNIIYFKEISYVRYMNSLMVHLMKYLELKKIKAKLLIYDSKFNFYDKYKPLRVVNGTNYSASKSDLINKINTFIVSEPNKNIIEDIITSNEAFDIVIIYDRMGELNDVVEGNNVNKLFVINSSNEYKNLKSSLKITDINSIITSGESTIPKDGTNTFIHIPNIPEYYKQSESSKSTKYFRLNIQATGESIINTILKKTKIR